MTFAIRPKDLWRKARTKNYSWNAWNRAVTRQNRAGTIWAIAYWPIVAFLSAIGAALKFSNEAFMVMAYMAFLGYFVGFVAILRVFFRVPPPPDDPPQDHSEDPPIFWN